MDKKEIRKKLIKERNALPESVREVDSSVICEKIRTLDCYLCADIVLMYASYGSEVCLDSLLGCAVKSGKIVCFPLSVFENDIPKLEFYEVKSYEELKTGYKGIREPDVEKLGLSKFRNLTDLVESEKSKIFCLVPGVGFDRNGKRMGYGKGFYDRFVDGGPNIFRVGVCFETQLQPDIPTDSHDVPMNIIVTEAGTYEISGD